MAQHMDVKILRVWLGSVHPGVRLTAKAGMNLILCWLAEQ